MVRASTGPVRSSGRASARSRSAGAPGRALRAGILLVTWAVAAGTGAPRALDAQEAPRLEEGRRLRVTSPAVVHHTLEGTLVERSATSLLLRPDGGGDPVELELTDVRRLQVDTGRHRATLRGAFAGFWSGLILGLIIYEIDESDDEIDPECGDLQCYENDFFAAMSLGGAAVGAGVGSLFHVTEWTDVPPGRLGLSAALVPGARGRAGAVDSVPLPSPALEVRLQVVF